MIGGGLARRYVLALFEVAKEKDVIDKVSADLQLLDETLKANSDLHIFLNNPSVLRRAKRSAMEELFKDASPYTMNLYRIVVDKNRTGIFDTSYKLFHDLVDNEKGIVRGVIHAAVKIEDDLFKQITETLEKNFNHKLELKTEIDLTLIGGLRVQIGNTVIDSSVKGRLNNLKQALAGA